MSKDSKPSHITMGGGFPIIKYWAEQTLTPSGSKLWQTLNHKSACLSCAWGTGGQKGGFANELGETLQRCMKSVEAIAAELQPGIEQHYFDQHSLSELQNLTSLEADKLGRLSFPVIKRAGSNHYQRISWPEIYQIATAACQKPAQRVASYSSGRSSNEAAFLLQLMMRSIGSNHLADCSDLCHIPSTIGLRNMFGSGTSMVSLESLRQADCVVLIGSNAPANHPRLMNELIALRDRGGQVIVINPVIEVGLVKFASPAHPLTSLLTGSEIASLYLQPIPGSDVALLVGIQKALLAKNLVQTDYLVEHAIDWQLIIDQARSSSWQQITSTCGIEQQSIEAAALMIGRSSAVVFAWAMGVTQQENGVDNIHAIANTALMTGNAGREGTGLMPIRGHSNVQGFGSMGVTAHLQPKILQAMERLLGRPLNPQPGYRTRELIAAAAINQVDTLICLGGNLYGANPNLAEAQAALGKIETIIYLATKPNLGHFHGLAKENTIIIPVFNRFENPHATTTESGNNFVRFNSPGTTHLRQADLIAEVEFIAQLAHRLHGEQPVDWRRLQDPVYIRQLIAQTIPGYGQLADIDTTKAEFTIPGRICTEGVFPTPTGKAQMFVTPLPPLTLPAPALPGGNGSGIMLALITGRSYSQHNTVVYKIGDRYRGMPHRHCILMNAVDAEAANFQEHQRVTVQGNAGQLEQVEVIFGEVRSGAALMFYPEVNVIFKAKTDPKSGIPAFKRVPVWVYQPISPTN
jgi:molybdopterin-dependent oxidoreductase alpha subunit